MSEPPPRKRFQIHLSTAIVLMLMAGGLIWANIASRVSNLPYAAKMKEWGWPWAAKTEWRAAAHQDSIIPDAQEVLVIDQQFFQAGAGDVR